ncbi:MAG: hypothetical protein GXY82_07990 [Methanospirillum sp.]|nr:hypothetical protein [Methanospirillum sp.]
MYSPNGAVPGPGEIAVTEDVVAYVNERGADFRVCTSCGGPVLLPVSVKAPKPTDIAVRAGDHTIYVSIYQARHLSRIHRGMIPFFTMRPRSPVGNEY